MTMTNPGILQPPQDSRRPELEGRDANLEPRERQAGRRSDSTLGTEQPKSTAAGTGTNADLWPGGYDPIEDVREGMEVFSADGKKIGTVGEVHIGTNADTPTSVLEPQDRSFFQVKRGILSLGRDIWLFSDSVQGVVEGCVTLRLTSDAAIELGSAEPPVPQR